MLQCKHIETMSQKDKANLLNALIVTREGYKLRKPIKKGYEMLFSDFGLCSHVRGSRRGKHHLKKILLEQFNTYQYPFNNVEQGDIDYWKEEDKSTNQKRMKFLNELIGALEAGVVAQMECC